jgi:hypothetical protein
MIALGIDIERPLVAQSGHPTNGSAASIDEVDDGFAPTDR